MIVCSIDLMGGKAVQLQQGKRLVLEREDVMALGERLGRLGTIAVIDLDAAMGTGNNADLVKRLCRVARCRVGGGLRDAARASEFLRAGAESVIVGTAASPELLKALPRDRTIVALDAVEDRVVTHGWTRATQYSPLEAARNLQAFCGGFLFTDVNREGMMGGIDMNRARELREAVDVHVTVAGGIRSVREIVELDRIGVDAQVGMAIYTGAIDPVQVVVQIGDFEKNGGLLPTIVCDEGSGQVRMLAYSSRESLQTALDEGAGVYWSRSRKALWRKGESSGCIQRLKRVSFDCDRDTLLFYVEQQGATCHTGAPGCFDEKAFVWDDLMARIASRANAPAAGSYTRRLLDDESFLSEKLMEEADEVRRAQTPDEVAWECADLLYFMSVKMSKASVGIADVMAQLASRAK